MRDDCERAQRRRTEFLEHHPVTDDVLDVVGHHRRGRGDEKNPIVDVGKQSEGARLAGGRARGANVGVQWNWLSRWRRYPGDCSRIRERPARCRIGIGLRPTQEESRISCANGWWGWFFWRPCPPSPAKECGLSTISRPVR